MKIISQDYLPVRTFILIGMVLLTTTQNRVFFYLW